MSWEAIAGFVGIWLTVLTAAIVTTRKLSEIEAGLREHTDKKVEAQQALITSAVTTAKNEFGETVGALKEHINIAHRKVDQMTIDHQKLELYIRDNYVEVTSFEKVVDRLEDKVDSMDGKLDSLILSVAGRSLAGSGLDRA